MFVVGTVYNFCTPHESLHTVQKTTPAMAAGITDHCWTMQELLSFQVPLPRWGPPKQCGRPSLVLQRLIERWSSRPRLSAELSATGKRRKKFLVCFLRECGSEILAVIVKSLRKKYCPV